MADGTIPHGVDVRLAGVTQQQSEAFGGLFVSMGVAILVVYVAMVLTFNSLITPFIILFSLPLATIGAFPALYVTGKPLGVSALIGFLMLIGIVVTNAIVLLDLVERLRSQGMSTNDALIEGGRTRVRPILMTAIATILALIPLAAGFNQGSIIAAELGTVVIGGLFSSTFLTLLVIPVVYSLVDGGQAVGSGRGRRRPSSPRAVRADARLIRSTRRSRTPAPRRGHRPAWRPRRPGLAPGPCTQPIPNSARPRRYPMAITRFAEADLERRPAQPAAARSTTSRPAPSPPAGDLGVAHRGAQRADQPRGAHRRCARRRASRWRSRRRLAKNGTPATQLDVKAVVTFDKGDAGWKIARSDLTVRGTVPGIDAGRVRRARRRRQGRLPGLGALKGNVELSVDAALA